MKLFDKLIEQATTPEETRLLIAAKEVSNTLDKLADSFNTIASLFAEVRKKK